MGRPLMATVAAQQAVIDDQRKKIAATEKALENATRALAVQGEQIALIARYAGITEDIGKLADINNPAQPVPDPGEQGPSETTEQTVAPHTNDDVRAPGQTGGANDHVPATATDVAITPGGTLPTSPYGDLQDVTAPVTGTPTQLPLEQTRIETDVRIGDASPVTNGDVAFPWHISPNQSNDSPPSTGEMAQERGRTSSRTYASLRLARLRMESGLGRKGVDDIALAAAIESDSTMTDEMIEHEISTLSSVAKAASLTGKPASGQMPRRTSAARSAPSLASPPASIGPDGGSYEASLFD